jgi:hypothetical protein
MTEDATIPAVARTGEHTLPAMLERFDAAQLRRLTSGQLARLVALTSRTQLEQAVRERDSRLLLLGEIFARMQEHLRPQRAQHMRALVRWRFPGGTGAGGYDRYETLFDYGSCTVFREGPVRESSVRQSLEEPRLTITMEPVDFVRLAVGRMTPAVLYVSGKIRVRGDVAFAAGLIGFFELPAP